KLTKAPEVFVGAAENPFAPPFEFRPLRLAKKVQAGAQFIQTQYCYDLPVLERFMTGVRALGLHERCFILVGVGPLASARAARWIRANVPGVHIPDPVIERIEKAPKQREEGKRVCIELVEQIREIEGVAGVHLMAYRQEESVAEIIDRAGILRGRKPHSAIAEWATYEQARAVRA
ncbi:MAG: methylenetetrahydrofolate reductase, partial [Geminicoccaceae bacterium]|nr:methylenetetrahydrofolate reductase [Geminicoccaceae bacterium]